MDKFRYTKEWEDKCRQWIWWKENCSRCLFEALCLFQQNQERIWKKQSS
jgi:hypothetical protein